MAYLADDSEEERLKNSASTSGAPADSGSTQPGGQQPAYTKSNFTSGRMILDKNKDTAAPNLIGGFQDQATARSKAIGEDTDKYNQDLATTRKNSQIGWSDINKGVNGDASQFSRIQQVLKGGGDLGTLNEKSGLDIQDVNKLNTQAGVSGELQKQAQSRGNYGYGQGQASLDAVLYGKNGRADQVNSALAQKQAIEKQAADANAAGERSRLATQKGMSDDVAGLKSGLSSRQAAINKAAAQAKQIANTRATSSTTLQDVTDKRRDEAIQAANDYAEKQGGGDPSYTDFLKKQYGEAIANNNDLFDVKTSGGNLYDANQANQFNRINQLLGTGANKNVNAGSADPQYFLGDKLNKFLDENLGQINDNYNSQQAQAGGNGQIGTGSSSPVSGMPLGGPPTADKKTGKPKDPRKVRL